MTQLVERQATDDGVRELAHIIQSDLSMVGDGQGVHIDADLTPSIETPWGSIDTEIDILDTKENESGIIVLASIKGDLGFFYSYSNLSEMSDIAIINLGDMDNVAFGEDSTVFQEFMRLQPLFKRSWRRYNDELEWTPT